MKINEMIRTLRKEKGLTQEQVANYLGVTAPAVNKWERGVSYPDITLLAPLARVLNTTVDRLLSFKACLTTLEISSFIEKMNTTFQKEGYEAGFNLGQDLLMTYPNSDRLIFSIAQMDYAYLAMLNASRQIYEPKIIALYKRLLSTQDHELKISVQNALATLHIHREEYDAARDIIEHIPNQHIDKRYLEAQIHEREGRLDSAYEIYEKLLYTKAASICQILQMILALQKKENVNYQQTVDLMQKTARLYDLGEMIYLAPLVSTMDFDDHNKTLDMLESIVEALGETRNFDLYKHVQMEVDGLKKSTSFMLLQAFESDPNLEALRHEPRYLHVIEKLKCRLN